MRKIIVLVTLLLVFFLGWSVFSKYASNGGLLPLKQISPSPSSEKVKIVTEESVVVDAVKKVGPSVVTVAEEVGPQALSPLFGFGPFSIFDSPDQQGEQPSQPQNIGSGFIVDVQGFIVTNKHVVSDSGAKYQIITSSDKKYEVKKIYRDPLNDVAILKIDPSENSGQTLTSLEMGDSSHLQVGQFVIAIGTALGEFKNTVTTGVISGLGRGITAGSEFQGFAEQIENVIQTDAAINPGNSGGPLLNSSAQVIGVNTAVAQSGQNIGFALPINVIKESLKNFNQTGQFNRPFLGVAYKMIDRDTAIINNLPQGAYVQRVVQGSPAEKAGIKKGDIIMKADGQRISDEKGGLASIIGKKKVGDTLTLTYWRDGKTTDVSATLEAAPNE